MNLLKQYYKKCNKQSWAYSFIIGSIFGLNTLLITCIVSLICNIKLLWLAIVVAVVVFLLASVLFYLFKFKPNEKEIAKRLDACGLEERVLTMTELKDSNSWIAQVQREDTEKALRDFDKSLLKFNISIVMIVLLCVSFLVGSGSITTLALYQNDVITQEELEHIGKKDTTKTFTLTYDASDGGVIEGDPLQLVDCGCNGTLVTAIADDGYVFVCWYVNGEATEETDPYRIDTNVDEDKDIIAYFQEAQSDDGDGEGDGEGDSDGDGSGGGAGEGANQPGSGESGNGNGNGNGEGNEGGEGQGAGGSHNDASNQIIDGDTDYHDTYKQDYSDAADELSKNGTSDENRKIGQGYFDSIQN